MSNAKRKAQLEQIAADLERMSDRARYGVSEQTRQGWRDHARIAREIGEELVAATPEAGPTDAKSADSELLDTIAHVAKGYASNECADRIMRLLRKREGGYPSVSLSRIYFEIAATVIGEAEVRRQRDEIIAGGSMETTGLASKEEAR